MNYKILSDLPKSGGMLYRHNIKAFIEEFMNIDAQIIEVDPIKEGYKSPESMQSTVINAAKRYGYEGRIKSKLIDKKLYFIKESSI